MTPTDLLDLKVTTRKVWTSFTSYEFANYKTDNRYIFRLTKELRNDMEYKYSTVAKIRGTIASISTQYKRYNANFERITLA